MKRIIWVISLSSLAFTAFLNGCKKSSSGKKNTAPYTCSSCTSVPEAVAANDASSKGIYIGVLIGSTGTIKFDIDNTGNTVTAEMTIDGTTVNLTSAITWVAGVAYTAPFTGTLNGQAVTINFSVNLSGQNPAVTSSTIPGHPNASFALAKETSTALIEAFEGTYTTTKPETGTFNIILSLTLKKWGAVARADGSSDISHGGGVISGVNLIDEHNNVIGTLNGDEINGKFNDGNGASVTLTGKRTL